MADINIGSDQLLVTTLNDNDRVTITLQETNQQIATITIEQFRQHLQTAILPDYRSLTEMAIPGEIIIGEDGTEKQVYGRRFIGTIPTDKPSGENRWLLIFHNDGIVRAPIAVSGYVMSGQWNDPILPPLSSMIIEGIGKYGIVLQHDGTLAGKFYNLFIKYIYR